MQYDFETSIDRANKGSLKWDKWSGKTDRHGRAILPLWVADTDFAAAPEILDALCTRVEHGVMGYTLPTKEAIDAVVNYLARVHGYEADPRWLHWVHGCVPALNVFARAFGEAGSEILTCTPVYPPFLSAPPWQERTLVTSHLKLDGTRWTFDFDDLEAKVTAHTTAFVLCSPHNPVGRVFTREELERLGEFCLRHNLVLCSDEIHCDLLFESAQHTMTNTLSPEIADITVTLNSPSKTYNLPGLSCAYAVIPNAKLRARFQLAARGFVTEVNTLGYTGCAAAYNHGESWRKALMAKLTENRDFLYQFVDTQLSPLMRFEQAMEATYLAWLNVEGIIRRGIQNPHAFLLEEAGVGLSPGADFGNGSYLRLNFGCTTATLKAALERIREALTSVSG